MLSPCRPRMVVHIPLHSFGRHATVLYIPHHILPHQIQLGALRVSSFCSLHRLLIQCLRRPFEPDWWLWLTLTGISIGCVCSIKWIGLFATAVVGLYTIEDLWEKFGDLRMPVVRPVLCRLRFRSDFHQADVLLSLGSTWVLPDCPSLHGLRNLLQDSLHRPEPLWPGRCTDAFAIPGELGRQ